jgi:anti-anti-sigma factor
MQARTLHCDVEKTGSHDSETGLVVTVTCHGQLVSETAHTLKAVVKPLIDDGGKIVLDFADVAYIDSMGLGALVGLKVSAINHGYCTLAFGNISKQVEALLHVTHLMEMFRA